MCVLILSWLMVKEAYISLFTHICHKKHFWMLCHWKMSRWKITFISLVIIENHIFTRGFTTRENISACGYLFDYLKFNNYSLYEIHDCNLNMYTGIVVACRHTGKTVQSDHAVMNKKAAIKTYFFMCIRVYAILNQTSPGG